MVFGHASNLIKHPHTQTCHQPVLTCPSGESCLLTHPSDLCSGQCTGQVGGGHRQRCDGQEVGGLGRLPHCRRLHGDEKGTSSSVNIGEYGSFLWLPAVII